MILTAVELLEKYASLLDMSLFPKSFQASYGQSLAELQADWKTFKTLEKQYRPQVNMLVAQALDDNNDLQIFAILRQTDRVTLCFYLHRLLMFRDFLSGRSDALELPDDSHWPKLLIPLLVDVMNRAFDATLLPPGLQIK